MKHTTVLFVSMFAVALFGCSESFESDGGGIRLMDGSGGDGDGGGIIRFMDGGGAGSDGGGIGFDASLTTRDAGDTTGVDCMGITCGATEQCCVVMAGGGATGECIAGDATCSGAGVDCDGPEDCSGDVCCGRLEGRAVSIGCEPAAACAPGAFGPFELCHTVADCTTPGQMCCPVMMAGFSGAYCSATCF